MDYPNFGYKNTYDNETDIYIICFNNPFFVEYQIKTLRAFFKTPFNIIIVDNNNWLHNDSSEKILEICKRENVVYLKAPSNYYQQVNSFDPSMKLGTTINWLYKNCIKVREPKYFGFLDQDCFLFKPFNVAHYLDKKNMYGRICKSIISEAWNIHVTNNFFRFDFVKDIALDFRASHKYQLDTGAANYDLLYKSYDSKDYDLHLITYRYAENDVNRKDSVQHYEIIHEFAFF